MTKDYAASQRCLRRSRLLGVPIIITVTFPLPPTPPHIWSGVVPKESEVDRCFVPPLPAIWSPTQTAVVVAAVSWSTSRLPFLRSPLSLVLHGELIPRHSERPK